MSQADPQSEAKTANQITQPNSDPNPIATPDTTKVVVIQQSNRQVGFYLLLIVILLIILISYVANSPLFKDFSAKSAENTQDYNAQPTPTDFITSLPTISSSPTEDPSNNPIIIDLKNKISSLNSKIDDLSSQIKSDLDQLDKDLATMHAYYLNSESYKNGYSNPLVQAEIENNYQASAMSLINKKIEVKNDFISKRDALEAELRSYLFK